MIFPLLVYTFIAFAPNAPNMAEASAITIFRILSHIVFFIINLYNFNNSNTISLPLSFG